MTFNKKTRLRLCRDVVLVKVRAQIIVSCVLNYRNQIAVKSMGLFRVTIISLVCDCISVNFQYFSSKTLQFLQQTM